MAGKGAINGYKAQSFDLALRKQQPIEWVTRRWLGFDMTQGVMFVDCENSDCVAGSCLRQFLKCNGHRKFSEARFDCDLP